jgi:hypothetical protein
LSRNGHRNYGESGAQISWERVIRDVGGAAATHGGEDGEGEDTDDGREYQALGDIEVTVAKSIGNKTIGTAQRAQAA